MPATRLLAYHPRTAPLICRTFTVAEPEGNDSERTSRASRLTDDKVSVHASSALRLITRKSPVLARRARTEAFVSISRAGRACASRERERTNCSSALFNHTQFAGYLVPACVRNKCAHGERHCSLSLSFSLSLALVSVCVAQCSRWLSHLGVIYGERAVYHTTLAEYCTPRERGYRLYLRDVSLRAY